jgi:hypothetical protein
MPWPPVVPPTTRANTTAQQDQHPTDHNQLAQALTDIVTKINALPLGRVASVAPTAATAGIGNAIVDLTGASVTFNRAANRRYRVTFFVGVQTGTTAGYSSNVYLTDGANAVLAGPGITMSASWYGSFSGVVEILSTTAQAGYVLKLRAQTWGGGATMATLGGAGNTTLIVEDIGAYP